MTRMNSNQIPVIWIPQTSYETNHFISLAHFLSLLSPIFWSAYEGSNIMPFHFTCFFWSSTCFYATQPSSTPILYLKTYFNKLILHYFFTSKWPNKLQIWNLFLSSNCSFDFIVLLISPKKVMSGPSTFAFIFEGLLLLPGKIS